MRSRTRRRRRLILPALWVGAVLCLGVGVNLYLALRPSAVEHRVRELLERVLPCAFELDGVELHYNGVGELRGLRLLAEGGDEVPVRVGSVRVRPRFMALIAGRFEVGVVVVEDLDLRVSRDRTGVWNIERLFPGKGGGGGLRIPDMVVERCRLVVRDEASEGGVVEEEIRDLRLTVASTAEGVLEFEAVARAGSAGGARRAVRKIEVAGRLELVSREPKLDLTFHLFRVDLVQVRSVLPERVARSLDEIGLEGVIDKVTGDVHVDGDGGLRIGNVGGSLVGCYLARPDWPFALRSLGGRFHMKGDTVQLREIAGELAGGRVRAEGEVRLRPGALEIASWSGRVETDSLRVDRDTRRLLPEKVRNIFERFGIEGRARLRLEVPASGVFPPREEDLEGLVEVEEGSLEYCNFPYRVEGVRGRIQIRDGRLLLDGLEGRGGDGVVEVREGSAEFRRGGTIRVVIAVKGSRGIRLDERFRRAFPDDMKRLWDDIQPAGFTGGEIRISRTFDGPSGSIASNFPQPIRVEVDARPRDARIVYRKFPYEIREVSGEISYDSVNKRVEFKWLRGRHREHEISAEGALDFVPSPRFTLRLRSESVVLDEDLVGALPTAGRKVLDDFGFSGTVQGHVDLFSLPDRGMEVVAKLDVLDGSVNHRRFPYPIQLTAGRLELVGDRFFEFSGFRGYREAEDGEATESSRPHALDATLGGSLAVDGSMRTLKWDVNIDRILVDDQLRKALPENVERFFENFGLGGSFRGRLEGSYVWDEEDPAAESVTYVANEAVTENATVDFGLRFKELVAEASFAGSWKQGDFHKFAGRINVGTAWFNRLRLTNGDIVFVFGRPHPEIEDTLRGEGNARDDAYRIPDEFVKRLTERPVSETFQMRVHSDDVYGGEVDGFLYVDTGQQEDLGGDFVGSGLQLGKASIDVFGVEGRNVTGLSSGNVRFSGRTRDVRTVTGVGRGLIQNARLVELPLFLGILSVLNLNFGDAGKGVYFDEVVLPYEIRDGKFVAKKIEIRSPSVKLMGGGTLDFKGNLDLDFQPRIFGFAVPVIEQILGLLKKGLAEVHIGGQLSDPRVEFRTAGSLLRIPIEASPPPDRQLPSDLRDGPGGT